MAIPAQPGRRARRAIPARPGRPGSKGDPGSQGPPGPSTGPARGDLTGNYPDPTIAAPEAWHRVGASGEPGWGTDGAGTPTPCFQNFDVFRAPVEFYRDRSQLVHIEGMMTRTSSSGACASNARIFVLPPGYRPAYEDIIPVIQNDSAAAIDVQSDGTIYIRGTPGAVGSWVSMGEISFRG